MHAHAQYDRTRVEGGYITAMEIRWNYDGIRMEVGLKYDDAMEIGWK